MNRSLILLLAKFCFCVSVANMVHADTVSDDVYSREVLGVHNKLINVLKSEVSKEKKCRVIYDHVHSNTRGLFITMGRLMHFNEYFNELILQYRGIKNLEDVADVVWPKLKAIANRKMSDSEYFKNYCLKMKENSNHADLLNKNREYVSTVFSDKQRVVMKTRYNDLFVYLTWVKEHGQWKLFNSTRKLPVNDALSANDKQSLEQIVTNMLLIEKFNTQCYAINKIFLDQKDAKVFLRYKFGNAADKAYREIVKAANNDTDTHVKETIRIFSHFGDCDKASMKQATFIVSMKLTDGMLDMMKKAVSTSSN